MVPYLFLSLAITPLLSTARKSASYPSQASCLSSVAIALDMDNHITK
ncbi:hypothetical protein [Prevotella sp.]